MPKLNNKIKSGREVPAMVNVVNYGRAFLKDGRSLTNPQARKPVVW